MEFARWMKMILSGTLLLTASKLLDAHLGALKVDIGSAVCSETTF